MSILHIVLITNWRALTGSYLITHSSPVFRYLAAIMGSTFGGIHLTTTSTSGPRYNVKLTLVPCTGTDWVFLFGGFDENDNLDHCVYLLNTKTMTWEVDDRHTGLYREGHLAVYIGQGNIFVFGGVPHDEFPDISAPASSDSTFRKDSLMMVYNIFDRKWIAAPQFAMQNAPSLRSRHACCLSPDGTKIYISGGLVNSIPLNELYCYNLATGVWHGPIDFAARFDHFITVYEGKLFSFGGLDTDMNHVDSSIVYFNFNDQSIGEVSLLLRPNIDNDHLTQTDAFLAGNCERVYADAVINSLLKIEVALPLWGFENNKKGITISYHDLAEFQHISLINLRNIDLSLQRTNQQTTERFAWKHSFVSCTGLLYVLGYEKPSSLSALEDEPLSVNSNLSVILQVQLADLGIPTGLVPKAEKVLQYGSLALVNDFKNMLIKEEFTDFEIITLKNDSIKDEYNDSPDKLDEMVSAFMTGNAYDGQSFSRIRVHKSILLARWPHFQRVISSGMNETVSNRMFIPEPYSCVKGLVFYLYTGSIDFSDFITPAFTIVDYSGLLILSNLYELADLRAQTLFQLFKSLNVLLQFSSALADLDYTIGLVLQVWKNSIVSNESVFVSKMIEIIKNNWSTVTRSKLFLSLPKHLIIRLCQDCVDELTIKNAAITSMDHSKTSSIDSASALPQTPNGSHVAARNAHSNSPFLRIVNHELLPSVQDRESLEVPSVQGQFPALQYLSNALTESIERIQ